MNEDIKTWSQDFAYKILDCLRIIDNNEFDAKKALDYLESVRQKITKL